MRILICGGGIAGLSTALALHGDGHELELIERADGWRAVGAGLHLPGNAVAPMKALGIADAVAAQSFAFPRIRYLDEKARRLFDLDLNGGNWPVFQALTRAGFHEILRSRLSDLPVRFDCTMTEVTMGKDAAAEVAFSDGSSAQYDLIVGADGIHSLLRAQLWSADLTPAFTGLSCWRWLTQLPAGQTEPHFMLGRGTVLLIMPVGEERAYVFASLVDPDGSLAEAGSELLRSRFAGFGGAVPELLSQLERDTPILPGKLMQMLVPRWHQKSAVLVGDAAHGTLPTMAQGATMAMEDALVLAESLRGHSEIPAALQAYEERRKSRAQWVQHQSLKRMGLARLTAPPLVFLRNQLMKVLGPKVLASGWRPLIDQAF